jgi:uncharacterized protein (TIGR02246 family)
MGTPQEIRAAWQGFADAWRAGDPKGAAAWYTADAINMPPGAPEMRGRQQIEEQFGEALASFEVEEFSNHTLECEEHGEVAYELGHFTQSVRFRTGGERHTERARYVAIWKKESDGVWRFHRFMWAPLPAEAA